MLGVDYEDVLLIKGYQRIIDEAAIGDVFRYRASVWRIERMGKRIPVNNPIYTIEMSELIEAASSWKQDRACAAIDKSENSEDEFGD